MPIINSHAYDNFNAARWANFTPPRDTGDSFNLAMKNAWRHSLGRQIFDVSPWGRSGDIERIKKEKVANSQVLTPEQAIREYPDSAKIIRKPVTRAEAIYWAREQKERKDIARAFSGKYDGYGYEWMPALAGGLTTLADPINIGIGLLSYGATLSIPAARKAITISNLVESSFKSRAAAAAFLSLDGAVGGAIAGAMAKPLYSANERKYGLADFTSELFFGSLVGAGLGGAFPRLASAQKPLLSSVDVADYMAAMVHLKKQMAIHGSRRVLDFVQDQSGALDLTGLVKSLAGRRSKAKVHLLDRLGPDAKRVVKEADVEFEDVSGLRQRMSASDFSDFSAYSAGIRKGRLKAKDKLLSLGVTTGGVRRWNGVKLGSPKPFRKMDLTGEVQHREGEFKKGQLKYSELFVPFAKGEAKGTQMGVPHYGSNSPEMAAAMYRAGKAGLKIEVGKVAFDRPVSLLYLDSPEFMENIKFIRQNIPESKSLLSDDELARVVKSTNWGKVPMKLKAKVMKLMKKHPHYQGIAYHYKAPAGKRAIQDVMSARMIVELNDQGIKKVSGFSSEYLEYDLKREAPDPDAIFEMVSGMHPDSVPSSVRNVMDDYYESRSIEGTNYFDTFIRRRSPLSESIYQDGSAPMVVKAKTAFGELDFSDVDTMVPGYNLAGAIQEVVTGIRKTVPDTRAMKKIGRLESVRQAIDYVDTSELGLLHEGLKKKGFKFPDKVPYNTRGDKPFFTQDLVIMPGKDETNMLQRAFMKPDTLPNTMVLDVPSRALDISLHPSVMTPEELQLGLSLVSDNVIPDVDDLSRATKFGKIAGEIKKRSSLLRSLGVSKVRYATGSRNNIEVSVGGESGGIAVKDLQERFTKLGKKFEVVQEGMEAKKPDERAAEYTKLFSNFQADSRGSYFGGFYRNIRQNVSGEDLKKALRNMYKEYEDSLASLDRQDIGSHKQLVAEGKVRQMESSFRKMSSIVDAVANSNIKDPNTRMGKIFKGMSHGNQEVLGLIGTSIDSPYWALGGDNIDLTRRAQIKKYHTALVRGLEEIGGSDLVWMSQSGVFDEDLLKIKHYRMKQREAKKGQTGTMKEETKELEVSPLAWKIYNHLEGLMGGLQKELTDSGYYREPRFDYIGTRFYDLRAISDTSVTEFVDDAVRWSDLDQNQSTQLYLDLKRSHLITYTERNRPLGDVTDKFNMAQRISFKDAKSELEFMKKYGSLKSVFSDSLIHRSDPRGGSAVFTGALLSIQRDSTLLAVNSWFGSRPLLTMDLMFGALSKKAREGLEAGFEATRASDEGFQRALTMGENMLDSLLFPARTSFSRAAEARKTILAMQNIGKLGLSVFRVFFSDIAASAAAMFRYRNPQGNKSPSIIGTGFRVMQSRFNAIRPSVRREVARKFNVLLSLDTRQYAGRFEGDHVGTISWLESIAMRGYGIPAATDIGKIGNATMMGSWLSDAFSAPWGGLTDYVQNRLSTFGITPEIWNRVRGLPNVRDTYDGVSIVPLDKLYAGIQDMGRRLDWTDRQINSAFRSFDTFFTHVAEEQGIPMQGTYESAMNLFNWDRHNPDSITHNVGKLFAQYKTIATAAARVSLNAMAEKAPGGRADFRVQNVAAVSAYLTFMAALATQAKNVAQGKTPQDMYNKEFWLNSFAVGGAMGLFGDLMLSDFTEDKSGVSSFALGPTLGSTGPNALLAARHLATGNWDKSWGNARRVALDVMPKITPAQDLFFNTFFLRSFGALSGFKTPIQTERKRMTEMGYDYWAD